MSIQNQSFKIRKRKQYKKKKTNTVIFAKDYAATNFRFHSHNCTDADDPKKKKIEIKSKRKDEKRNIRKAKIIKNVCDSIFS